jgi:hypothetical protein
MPSTMKATSTFELLGTPSEDKIVGSRLWDYMRWLDERQGRKFADAMHLIFTPTGTGSAKLRERLCPGAA